MLWQPLHYQEQRLEQFALVMTSASASITVGLSPVRSQLLGDTYEIILACVARPRTHDRPRSQPPSVVQSRSHAKGVTQRREVVLCKTLAELIP